MRISWLAAIGAFYCTAVLETVGLMSVAKADEITYRSIPLGITRAEFRKLPFPDSDSVAGVVTICTGDKSESISSISQLNLHGDLASAGVTICRYFRRSNIVKGLLTECSPELAGMGTIETTFLFSPSTTGGDDGRLYSIEVEAKSENFDFIASAIKRKYGDPASVETSVFRTRAGASFDNDIYTWSDHPVYVRIKRYNENLDQSDISYIHIDIGAEILEKVRGIIDRRMKKI